QDLDAACDGRRLIPARISPAWRGSKWTSRPGPRREPMAEPKPARRPRLTVGMACYDDFNGVYFTIQSLRMYHPEVIDDLEFLVVDNHPDGADGQTVRDLVTNWLPNARYVPAPKAVGTSAPRDLLFRLAEGEAVLCLDCHVLLAPGSVRRLLDFYAAHP